MVIRFQSPNFSWNRSHLDALAMPSPLLWMVLTALYKDLVLGLLLFTLHVAHVHVLRHHSSAYDCSYFVYPAFTTAVLTINTYLPSFFMRLWSNTSFTAMSIHCSSCRSNYSTFFDHLHEQLPLSLSYTVSKFCNTLISCNIIVYSTIFDCLVLK